MSWQQVGSAPGDEAGPGPARLELSFLFLVRLSVWLQSRQALRFTGSSPVMGAELLPLKVRVDCGGMGERLGNK